MVDGCAPSWLRRDLDEPAARSAFVSWLAEVEPSFSDRGTDLLSTPFSSIDAFGQAQLLAHVEPHLETAFSAALLDAIETLEDFYAFCRVKS